jgi:hypothetical protein
MLQLVCKVHLGTNWQYSTVLVCGVRARFHGGGHGGKLDACPMFPWDGVGAGSLQPPLQLAPSVSPP